MSKKMTEWDKAKVLIKENYQLLENGMITRLMAEGDKLQIQVKALEETSKYWQGAYDKLHDLRVRE
jgi:hypothetical protein